MLELDNINVVYLPFLSVFFQEIHTILSAVSEGRSIVESLESDFITTKERRAMVRILVSHLIERCGQT